METVTALTSAITAAQILCTLGPWPEVSESDRQAVEAALLARFGADKPLSFGASGNSPYSSTTTVFGPPECRQAGTRVRVARVCRSFDGHGQSKRRGRCAHVLAVAPAADGPLAVCAPTDRGAEPIGTSSFWVRPWPVEEAERASAGLGLGAPALAAALAALSLPPLPPPPPVVVTRHPGLVEVLRERGQVPEGTKVIAHATREDVAGRHVYGVLPLALAAEAESVTEVTLDLPAEARGKELSAAEVRQYMTGISRYTVRLLSRTGCRRRN